MAEKDLTKYEKALAKYNTSLKDSDVSKELKDLLDKKLESHNTPEVKKFIFNCIDLTTLQSTDSQDSVLQFTEKVNKFEEEYPEFGHVGGICVYPVFAKTVSSALEVDDVDVVCVAGGFPDSQTFTEIKIAETSMALHDGATEVDIVISVGSFLAGDYEYMCEEIEEIKDLCKEHTLKVILETGALKTAENIKKASLLAMYSGADIIKTSTGKMSPAATPEAAFVMCQAIKEYYKETGRKVGFKPAGGVSSVRDALVYYTIVREVLGEEWMSKKLFRVGTSRLTNLILSELVGKEIKFF